MEEQQKVYTIPTYIIIGLCVRKASVEWVFCAIKMIKKASFIFLLGLICSCSCDVSAISSSGWHPSPASLALPGEYGAPPLPTATSVQVSEENIQFAGQTVEVNQPAAQRPSNTYLAATSARIQSKPTKFAQVFVILRIIWFLFIILWDFKWVLFLAIAKKTAGKTIQHAVEYGWSVCTKRAIESTGFPRQ